MLKRNGQLRAPHLDASFWASCNSILQKCASVVSGSGVIMGSVLVISRSNGVISRYRYVRLF